MTVEELNVIVSANKDDFDRKIRMVNENLVTMKDQAEKASAGTLNSFKSLATGLSALGIAHFFKEANDSYKVQMENELKLETIMKQRMGATDAEITQVKELASAQQQIGIIGDEVQLAGAQQIATFATQESTVKRLIPAMNNLLAQQNGYNSTTGDAVSIGNLMGKVLQGQTSALTRVGITFSEAQENILKYGTEEQKAATLAQVITDNVGDMNEALRNTPTGQMTALNNDIGDIKEQVGATLQPLISSIVPVVSDLLTFSEPVLNMLNEAMKSTASMLDDIRTKVEAATPAQQTMLKIAIGMAVAIPAVTAATRLMRAAKLAYTGVLNILIPKQLTYASALKATMGWIGIIVGALALLGIATNKGTEGIDDNSEKLKEENEAADKAAEGVDDVAESTDNLTDSVKRSLAGFDELNRLSGNSGTLASSVVSSTDVDNAEGLADALGDVQEQINGTSFDFSFDGIYNSLKEVWQWLTTDGFKLFQDGFNEAVNIGSDIWSLIFGDEDEKYTGLKNLTDRIQNLFGEDFVNFFKGVGEDIYNIFNGNEEEQYKALKSLNDRFKTVFGDLGEDWSDFWQGVGEGIYKFANGDLRGGLDKINSMFEGLFGDLGKDWSNFWQNVGAGLYEMTHADELKEIDLSGKYGTDIGQAQLDSNEYMRSGYGPTEAWNMALEKNGLTSNEALYAVKQFSTYDPQKAYEELLKSGQINNPDTWGGLGLLGLKKYADGGFPDYGDLFIANEAGPELVGTIGNRTAVANSSSIETAIYNAVRSAMSDSTGGQPADIHVTVDIDGDTVGETVARYNAVRNRRLNGRS